MIEANIEAWETSLLAYLKIQFMLLYYLTELLTEMKIQKEIIRFFQITVEYKN